MKARLENYLDSLRLTLHPHKSRIHRTRDGITFLGWRITPEGVWMKRDTVVRMRRRFRQLQRQWAAGEMEWDEIQQRVHSWIGHAQWGNTWHLRQQMFDEFPFLATGRMPEPEA
jgi:hypothetical protein